MLGSELENTPIYSIPKFYYQKFNFIKVNHAAKESIKKVSRNREKYLNLILKSQILCILFIEVNFLFIQNKF